jgi:tetratricopeptide (TPR) repeat protein
LVAAEEWLVFSTPPTSSLPGSPWYQFEPMRSVASGPAGLSTVAAVALFLFFLFAPRSAAHAEQKERKPTLAQTAEIRRLEKDLADQQVKQAYAAAIPIARKLYALQCEATGNDSPAARSREQLLANVLQGAGRYVDALEVLEKMLKTAETATGPASRQTLQALASVNAVYWAQGRYDDLLPIAQRMLAITKTLDGEQSQTYATQLAQLGTLYNFRSEFSAAQRCYEESLAIQEAIPANKDSLTLLGAVQTLAYFYWMTNQQPKGIAFYNRALRLRVVQARRRRDGQRCRPRGDRPAVGRRRLSDRRRALQAVPHHAPVAQGGDE